jgi:hypothetical protein
MGKAVQFQLILKPAAFLRGDAFCHALLLQAGFHAPKPEILPFLGCAGLTSDRQLKYKPIGAYMSIDLG